MNTINGSLDADIIQGTDDGDIIKGFPGNDILIGGNGYDEVFGDAGDDLIYAGSTVCDDTAGSAESSNFSQYANFLSGGEGDDILISSHLDDFLAGGPGNDLLRGYLGDDLLQGGDGKDELKGYHGNDSLFGGGDNDTLRASRDSEVLNGGSGDDRLVGYNDFVHTNRINLDSLTGGHGADRFILGYSHQTYYQAGGFNDLAIIEDFDVQQDTIQLNGTVEDYSLELGTYGVDHQAGTYLYYNIYAIPEAIAFIVGQEALSLTADYVEFV
jgi:Ca2+-binding RTX toxin-like protein